MKKIFLSVLFVITLSIVTKAQTTTASGHVTDSKGNPVPYVFVADEKYKEASVYTDSLGNFSIILHPDSKPVFAAPGYKDTSVTASNNTSLQVILKGTGVAGSVGSLTEKSMVREISEKQRPDNMDLRLINGHERGNVRGSQFLFDNFVHGFVINSNDELITNPSYLFNYDKIGGTPIYTKDNKTPLQISWDLTKSFSLFTNAGVRCNFEKFAAIDNAHFLQVLSTGKKYKIYKLIKTKFVKADYVNTGVTQHGNDYDEYIDDADYYVVDIQANQQQKLSLKKKSIKDAFPKEADKVNKYLSDNSGRIDDNYLSKLADYMNQ